MPFKSIAAIRRLLFAINVVIFLGYFVSYYGNPQLLTDESVVHSNPSSTERGKWTIAEEEEKLMTTHAEKVITHVEAAPNPKADTTAKVDYTDPLNVTRDVFHGIVLWELILYQDHGPQRFQRVWWQERNSK